MSRADADARSRVEALAAKLGAQAHAGDRAPAGALCVLTPWGSDATAAALDEGLDARHCVALDAWFGLATRRTVMSTPVTQAAMREAAHALFASDGVPVTMIRDCPGFIAPRVVAQIVNVACDIAQQRIAGPEDIDRAVTLGLGYPRGPLAMGDALGALRVLRCCAPCRSTTAIRAIGRARGSRGARSLACRSPPRKTEPQPSRARRSARPV